MRPSQRAPDALREVTITRNYTKNAEGSVLIQCGNTKIICTASVIPGVPRFLKGAGKGWITAEYGMLPRSTNTRMGREAAMGKQTGRTQEIQRLIGRALRACVDLTTIGENTITLDCDVIQADGGTRTASITGACVALIDALRVMQEKRLINKAPSFQRIAAVSVGIYNGEPVLDLDYPEDSSAQADVNIIMNEKGEFIEIQGAAEKSPFSHAQFDEMLVLAKLGITQLLEIQEKSLQD